MGKLVRALRALVHRGGPGKPEIDLLDSQQMPKVNQLWVEWLRTFGPGLNIGGSDAEAAHERGYHHIVEYKKSGDVAVLEEAIEDLDLAVGWTPRGSARRPLYLSELGGGLRERFIRRPQGRADLDKMFTLFEEARSTIDPKDPFRPSIVNNLGNAYFLRYEIDQDRDDLDDAIACYEEARSSVSAGSRRLSWGHNLASALKVRFACCQRREDIDRAIDLAQELANSVDADPAVRSNFLSGLAGELLARFTIWRDRQDLDRAITVSEEALSLSKDKSDGRSALLFNYGLALSACYEAQGSLEDLRSAIDAWENAWSFVHEAFFRSGVAYKLGQQQQWTKLCPLLVSAHLQLFLTEQSTEVQDHALWRALELTEASRSRLLVEMLGRADMPTPKGVSMEDVVRERLLLSALTELDTRDLIAEAQQDSQPALRERPGRFQQRQSWVAELEKLWGNMSLNGPDAEAYVARRRGASLQREGLARLADEAGSETLLMSVISQMDRTFLLVLRSGWETPLAIPFEADWPDIRARLFREVHSYKNSLPIFETWDSRLRSTFEDLLNEPAAALVQGVRRIVVAPYGVGHLIPWAVVVYRAGWRDEAGGPIPVVTVPAFSVLAQRRARHRSDGSALVVGYAGVEGDLRYAEEEAKIIGQRLDVKPLVGAQEATKREVLSRLPGASIAHFATHGRFVENSPLESGIELVDGYLSAREILGLRLKADLVVLSACETGANQSLGGEEFVGLAQSFLQAGARSVIASLWQVEDEATGVLASSFYETLKREDKAAALSQAMGTVQQNPNWSHPYYWGPFILYGDWRSGL